MNQHFHRVIFSKSQQCFVVVSELAKRKGKSSVATPKISGETAADFFALACSHLQANTAQSLNRDVANANQKLEKQDLTKAQERQEMAQTIGQISEDWLQFTVGDKLEEAAKKRQEADAIEKDNPTKSAELKAQAQERQEMAQTIGQISEDWFQFAVGDKLKEADKKHQEAAVLRKKIRHSTRHNLYRTLQFGSILSLTITLIEVL